MKIIGALLLFLLLTFGSFSVVAAAANSTQTDLQKICKEADDKPSYCTTITAPTENPIYGPNGIITKVTNAIAYISGSVAIIMIIYGGITYIISNGDSQKTVRARQIITYALVGLVIIVIAKFVIIIVVDNLT